MQDTTGSESLPSPLVWFLKHATGQGVAEALHLLAVAATALSLSACGSDGSETFNVVVSGDLAPLRPAGDVAERSLQVALVWGEQWLADPFCLLPPETDTAATVIAAGCRDPFGFAPASVAASAPIAVGKSTTLTYAAAARIVYGSLVVYDDRNGSGTLELSEPQRTSSAARGGQTTDSVDIIYGASFLTMTEPDQRVAYREGGFDATGSYYPRAGCSPPSPGFSIVGAGGVTAGAALQAAATGTLPKEDPASCAETSVSATVVNITARAPADVVEVACHELPTDGRVYVEPPANRPDFTGRLTACVHVEAVDASGPRADAGLSSADGGAGASSPVELVVSGRATDKCKGLTHYTLRGCDQSVSCLLPDWDLTANPPVWWPCPN